LSLRQPPPDANSPERFHLAHNFARRLKTLKGPTPKQTTACSEPNPPVELVGADISRVTTTLCSLSIYHPSRRRTPGAPR
ncbi:MAG TPA: hypothetical protein VK638_24985, partial [Edaphobacter sp.]|nr:hypothetical protein [Edaphobacter sp.]